jgi:hypothetical protein
MTMIYASNPAEGRMIPVRFIRWFNRDHTYARVEFPDGSRWSVPANLLKKSVDRVA